jgi:lantibiotic leader peptide-processing serine protease
MPKATTMSTCFLTALVITGLGFAQPAPVPAAVPITIVFKSETLPVNVALVIARAGGTMTAAVPQIGVAIAVGPAGILAALNADPQILAATPELVTAPPSTKTVEVTPADITTAADLYKAYQWDIKQVTNDGASFGVTIGSHNTVVGIIDTGASRAHAALAANLLGGRNFTPDGPGGVVLPDDFDDRNGHGSHVAGAIAGLGRILGVGPGLGFRAYRIFGATGGAPTSRILQAVVAATDDGVDVISMSLGGFDVISGGYWTDPVTGLVTRFKDIADFLAQRRAVQYAVKHGVVVVAAAGNDGTDIGNPTVLTGLLNAEYGSQGYTFYGASRETPGTLAGVLTVSATGLPRTLASYSNYGAGAIDVAAPGGDNLRYPVGDWYTDMCLSAYKGIGYSWMDGTSMATPKVSAVVALLIDAAKAQGRHLGPQYIVTRVQQSAVPLGSPGDTRYYGHGMVNAFSALTSK